MTKTRWFFLILGIIGILCIAIAAAHAEKLQIHWAKSPSANVVRYVVYRSVSQSSGFAAIDSTGAAPADTIYIDNNVPAGTRYYYRLRAVASDGQRSALSVSVDGLHILPSDPAPTVKVLSVTKTGPNTYQVAWSTSVPTVGFLLSRVVGSAWSASPWDISLATSHTITLTGLTEPAQYEFRAAAYPTPSPLSVTVSSSFLAALAPAPEPGTLKRILPF
jgi:hypothetical protein